LNPLTSGHRVDLVPGNVEQLQMDVQRFDIFTNRMHQAFGYAASASNLADHTDPFQVQEIRVLPSGIIEATVYVGCWFSNIGREYTATGDRVVQVNAQIEVTDTFEV
jgi:hypothetical protein